MPRSRIPVFDEQSRDLVEVPTVAGHQHGLVCERDCSNLQVLGADAQPLADQRAIGGRRFCVERQDRHAAEVAVGLQEPPVGELARLVVLLPIDGCQPPAQLLQQRLREQLGQRRPVLTADQGAAQARNPAANGQLPWVLTVELEEFSQIFSSPTASAGIVRVRATVVDLGRTGQQLRGQRVFIVQQPARTADAAGGVAALTSAATQVASDVEQWLQQLGQ